MCLESAIRKDQTMGYLELILAFGVMWMVQIIFALRQQKHIRETLASIKRTYNSGYAGTGLTRSKFNIGPGVLVIVVVDDNDVVKDYRVLTGLTVFARFKQKTTFIGQKLQELEFKKSEYKISKANLQAVEQIRLISGN